MGETIKFNKEEGEWKIPTNDGEIINANWVDDIDAPRKKAKADKFEFYEDEVGYKSRDVVSGEAENNIASFLEAKKKMARVAYNARKAA